jgi:hypothetical protein
VPCGKYTLINTVRNTKNTATAHSDNAISAARRRKRLLSFLRSILFADSLFVMDVLPREKMDKYARNFLPLARRDDE